MAITLLGMITSEAVCELVHTSVTAPMLWIIAWPEEYNSWPSPALPSQKKKEA